MSDIRRMPKDPSARQLPDPMYFGIFEPWVKDWFGPQANGPTQLPADADAFEAAAAGKAEVKPVETQVQPSLVEQIEACETIEALNSFIVSKSFAEAKKKLPPDAVAEVETAIKARRHGLGAAA